MEEYMESELRSIITKNIVRGPLGPNAELSLKDANLNQSVRLQCFLCEVKVS